MISKITRQKYRDFFLQSGKNTNEIKGKISTNRAEDCIATCIRIEIDLYLLSCYYLWYQRSKEIISIN